MSVELSPDTPVAEQLHAAIQPKLVEIGWSTGGADDSALAEYIILMLVNGKTQEQIAAELSGDLLNLGPDDPGAREFAQWLFQQVEFLKNGGQLAPIATSEQVAQATDAATGDEEMGGIGENAESNVYVCTFRERSACTGEFELTASSPTGPKSMRNGAGAASRGRDKRMFGQLVGTLERSKDAALHRVRPYGGNERINMHSRATPTGPRAIRGTAGRANNPRPAGMNGGPQSAAGNIMAMTPQQQMELYAMLEQQSRLMAQMFTPQQQRMMAANGGAPGMQNGGMGRGGFQQNNRGSLFDRVQGRPNRGGYKNGFQQKTEHKPAPQADSEMSAPGSSMDVELTPAHEKPSPNTTCKFNLTCKNKDCIYAHQSPAAPPGTAIDVSDVCSFGAACVNRKCTGRHPSPAQKAAHQSEQDCKFFPNCTNPRCTFRHPSMPLCRNGADCPQKDSGCRFTHLAVKCRFNPCLNPSCQYQHEEGQKRGKFEDKVWVAGQNGQEGKEHVSERKFVDEGNAVEELIVPGNPAAQQEEELAA